MIFQLTFLHAHAELHQELLMPEIPSPIWLQRFYYISTLGMLFYGSIAYDAYFF